MVEMSVMFRWVAAAWVLTFPVHLWAKPSVVLDPGHGGDKSGTKSTAGLLEKDVCLAIAMQAASVLRKSGVRVYLTRQTDVDLPLPARVAVANTRGAAVYVSIHNNWAPVSDRRGVEVYVLSASASDEVASALLHAEEQGVGDEDTFGGGAATDLDYILGDLDRTTAHRRSALLARRVQDALAQVKGLGPSRGLRQAPFLVLQGAHMPAVLVEVGYLSHAGQARYLGSRRGQRSAGRALAQGIITFLKASS